MKSRTSFFNFTALRKDITRFAPAWTLYTVMLGLFLIDFTGYSEASRVSSIADSIGATSVIMMVYGCLVAQILFGDLFNSRMCNMLHALPLRRESWFCAHLIAGILFALVPNLLVSLLAIPMLGNGWTAAMWWLLGTMLEYVFFFGLAIVCVMSVGSRFAQVVVYGIANFASMLAYGFATVVYEPLLRGIYLTEENFVVFSPVWQMCQMYDDFLDVITWRDLDYSKVQAVVAGDGWGYLAICALIGVGLILLALQMYRKRKLESAGDFIAVRLLEPVFAVIFALCSGTILMLFADLLSNDMEYIFLSVGLVVGFFVAKMLLKRTTRVFNPRTFVQIIALCAVVVLSLVLVVMDVTGITRYVPEVDDVKTVTIGSASSSGRIYNSITLEAESDISDIIQLHNTVVTDPEGAEYNGYFTTVGIRYSMKDGSVVSRYYTISVESRVGKTLERYYSSVECVTGMTAEELYALAENVNYIVCYGGNDSFDDYAPQLDYTGLIDAIIADCEAGNMAQEYGFHSEQGEYHVAYFSMSSINQNFSGPGFGIDLFNDCVNTLNWLKENGFYQEPAE